jgi:hypothetical protein
MQTLLDHKEFIQGLKLGNCPSPDNQTLIEVIKLAEDAGIKENWVCTCDANFKKLVNRLFDYCEANVWNQTPKPIAKKTKNATTK